MIIQIIIVHNEIYAPSVKKLLIMASTGDSTPSDRHGEDLFKKVIAKLTLISDFKVKLFFITLRRICYQIQKSQRDDGSLNSIVLLERKC